MSSFLKEINVLASLTLVSLLTTPLHAAVANLAIDAADGVTNLYPTLPLAQIGVVNENGQPENLVGTEFNEGYLVSGAVGAGSGNYRTLFGCKPVVVTRGLSRATTG